MRFVLTNAEVSRINELIELTAHNGKDLGRMATRFVMGRDFADGVVTFGDHLTGQTARRWIGQVVPRVLNGAEEIAEVTVDLARRESAPAFVELGTSDDETVCGQCGREELRRTTLLGVLDADGNIEGVVFMGRDCAASALARRA